MSIPSSTLGERHIFGCACLKHKCALTDGDGAFSHKIDYVKKIIGDSKSQRASKSHNWFKSYGDFAEWVDFAYQWSCIGKRLRLQPEI